MNFSTRAEYGLRAMTVLAQNYPNTLSITEISEKENISQKYLEQLMSELRKNDLVQSHKGKGGGYMLSKKPSSIFAGEIIEALEGKIEPVKCQSEQCQKKNCASKKVWVTLGKEIKNTLYKIKLSDLME